jgi:hypothetical protein
MAKREPRLGKSPVVHRIRPVLLSVAITILSLAALANALTKPLGRDEHMYCTAGVLLAQGRLIYRDFCYVAQLPYHPLCLSILYRLLPTTHYLLIGRLLSVVCNIGTMVGILYVFRRAFGSLRAGGAVFGLLGVLLYAFNPAVEYANGYAWNNDMVVFCIVLAFCLYLSIDPARPSKYGFAAGIGVVMGLATWTRMTTAAYLAVFLLMLVLMPATDSKERVKTGLWFLSGAAVVSLWPISVIVRAPRAFVVDVFRIHMLNSEWLHDLGVVYPKSHLVATMLLQPGFFVLFLIAAFLFGVLLAHRRRWGQTQVRATVLAAILTTMAFVSALVLPTIWQQYLAPPVPLMVMSFAYPLAFLQRGFDGRGGKHSVQVASILMCLAAVVAVGSKPAVIARIAALGDADLWTPVRVHRISRGIVGNAGPSKLVLTTAPLFSLEGGGRIYPEFAAGPFPYRIGAMLSQAERRLTNTVGPDGIEQLVAESPPSVVLLGIETGPFAFLEEPLRAVAGEDWIRTSHGSGLIAYHRP